MAIKFSNLASTTLASGVSSTATSVSVTSASSFPTLGSGDYFYATIGAGSGSEIVKVTGISGTTFTVSRGEDGTTAVSHSAGVDVALRVTAGTLEDLRDGGQVYTAGSGLGLSGNEFTNTAPDQTVSISGSGSTTVTGTYPSFTVSSTSYSHPSAHPISFITGLQTALDGKVDDSQVLTDVPVNALFTDTVYTHPTNHSISFITGLQSALDGKVDDSQVLTNVPSGALFTDTVYTLPFTDNSTNWNTAYGWGDHSTGGYLTSHQSLSGYATETYVGTQISNLVDSSPAALNTLNELAAALGDDPNFATTVSTSIGTKLPLAGGTLTGALSGTTATFSGSVTASGVAALTRGNGSVGAPNTANHDTGTRIELYNSSATSWYAIGIDSNTMWFNSDNHYRFYTDAVSKVDFDGNGVVNAVGGYKVNGTTVIDSSGVITSTGTSAFNRFRLTDSSKMGFGTIKSSSSVAHTASDDEGIFWHVDNGYGIYRLAGAWSSPNYQQLRLNWITGIELNGGNAYGKSGVNIINSDLQIGGTPVIDASRTHFSGIKGYATTATGNTSITASTGIKQTYAEGWTAIYADYDPYHEWGIYHDNPNNYFLITAGTATNNIGNFSVVNHAGNTRTAYAKIRLDQNTGEIRAGGGYYVSNTQVLDTSRNLTNIGTLNGGTAWRSNNDGSGSGLDADLLDGYNTSTSATANTVVVREGSGHIYGNYILGSYFNASYGNSENPTIGQIWTQSTGDDYLRKSTPAHLRSQLGLWWSGNDGSGSGLDADLFDGRDSISYVFGASGYGTTNSGFASLTNAKSGFFDTHNSGTPTGTWYSLVNMAHYGSNHGHQIAGSFYSAGDIYNRNNNNTSLGAWAKIWNTANDGSGSGLDADLLDGQQGSYYAPATGGSYLPLAGGTLTGNLNTSGSGNYVLIGGSAGGNAYNTVPATTGLMFGGANDPNNYSIGTSTQNIGGNYTKLNIKWHTGIRFFAMPQYGGARFYSNAAMSTETFSINNLDGHVRAANNLYANGGNLVWNASNDGSGSGLDADLLDGQQGSYYYAASNPSGYITSSGTANQSHMVSGNAFATTGSPGSILEYQQASGQTDTRLAPTGDWYNSIRMGHGNPYSYYSNTMAMKMTGTGNGTLYTQVIANNSAGGWNKYWHTNNDGSGSGLDADLLDGVDSTSFIRSDTADTFTGTLTMGTQQALVANNYGRGVFGLYSSTRYQHVWSMGTAYKTSDDGTSYGSMYGLTWTHPNIGTGANQSIASLSHQLQLREAGLLKCAFGTGIWTAHSITSGNQGTLWGSSNDGSGSGLDADLLDGMDSQRFNRGDNNYGVMVGTSGWNMNDLFTTRNRAGFFDVWSGSNFPPSTSHVHGIQVRHNSSAHYGWQLAGQYAQNTLWHRQVSNNTWGSWNQQWGSGNDGSGSGLDADLFDGRDSTSYVFGTSGYGGTNQGFASLTNAKSGFFDVYNSGTPTATWYSLVNMAHYGSNHGHQIAGSFYSAGDIYNRNNNNTSLGAWAKIWNTANDGSGSGLDADTVDGVQAASFLRSDATDYQENTIYQRGYLVNETGYRDRGVFGSYDSTKTNHIWSMGVAYKNHASGANFGNLYGLAYKHTNNPTGGALASGHQMVWCQNGGPTSAMGSNIWTSGSVYAASFLYNSDRAFKTNIKPIKNALSTVLSLCGVSYTLKKSGKNTTGFIAQEVEKVLPDMVDGDEGEKGVNYGQMVALLTEAMREQQNLIVSLQKEIQELKDATK